VFTKYFHQTYQHFQQRLYLFLFFLFELLKIKNLKTIKKPLITPLLDFSMDKKKSLRY